MKKLVFIKYLGIRNPLGRGCWGGGRLLALREGFEKEPFSTLRIAEMDDTVSFDYHLVGVAGGTVAVEALRVLFAGHVLLLWMNIV